MQNVKAIYNVQHVLCFVEREHLRQIAQLSSANEFQATQHVCAFSCSHSSGPRSVEFHAKAYHCKNIWVTFNYMPVVNTTQSSRDGYNFNQSVVENLLLFVIILSLEKANKSAFLVRFGVSKHYTQRNSLVAWFQQKCQEYSQIQGF